MSIQNTGKRKVRPIHPGEMLREDFLPECGLTVSTLAEALRVSRQTINELFRELVEVLLLARFNVQQKALWFPGTVVDLSNQDQARTCANQDSCGRDQSPSTH